MLKVLVPREESEWFVRVSLQLFNLAQGAFHEPRELAEFKNRQMELANKLRECRASQLELNEFIAQYTRDVESGVAAKAEHGNPHVLIDGEPKLNRLFSGFIDSARIVLRHLFGQKDNPDSVSYLVLKRSISFVQVFKDAEFEKLAAEFLKAAPGEKAQALVDMLRGDRNSWSNVLIGTRNRLEHDVNCPTLKLGYGVVGGIVRVAFPTINRNELRAYLNTLWENLYQTVEETVVLCLAIRMPDFIVPARIPDHLIDPNLPFRWSFAVIQDPKASSRQPQP